MNRSPLKKALKVARRTSRPDPQIKRGFRKLVVDGLLYQWRHHGAKVEIRTPENTKHMVPTWELQGYANEEAWLKEHEDCYDDYCGAHEATPSMIRGFLFGKKAAEAVGK
jgi:hypothetical protein